jgi:hypothetical protein
MMGGRSTSPHLFGMFSHLTTNKQTHLWTCRRHMQDGVWSAREGPKQCIRALDALLGCTASMSLALNASNSKQWTVGDRTG